jgi:hypothetical protein
LARPLKPCLGTPASPSAHRRSSAFIGGSKPFTSRLAWG